MQLDAVIARFARVERRPDAAFDDAADDEVRRPPGACAVVALDGAA